LRSDRQHLDELARAYFKRRLHAGVCHVGGAPSRTTPFPMSPW
jgi:hypothetical protein